MSATVLGPSTLAAPEPPPPSAWELFILRHKKPANLVLHALSAILFLGSPLYGYLTHRWSWFAWWCLSGLIGNASHYLFQDGNVTLRQGTSSPAVVGYNFRMWWRILTGRYGRDIAEARARLVVYQTALDRTALVTGCSSGIGAATARAFVAHGWRVLATVRRAEDGARLQSESARIAVLPLDLTRPEQLAAVVARAQQSGIDALVNNAAFGVFGAFESLSAADLRDEMEVNFFGAAELSRKLIPDLRDRGGVLINISSPAGVTSFPWTSAYCASKHALEGLTESLHHELAGTGLRVHLVTPSAQQTAFLRNARWATNASDPHQAAVEGYRRVLGLGAAKTPTPEAVAEAIVDLAEREQMPFRLDLGVNVRVLRSLVRWLPRALQSRLMAAVFRRAARAPVPSASSG